MKNILSDAELLQLRRWNTPTIYNGWEQITKEDHSRVGINIEETHDYMPEIGAMVGYAVTCVIQPGNKEHQENLPDAWNQYWAYIESVPGPKIVVVQDLDKPATFGAAWGEVNANVHRAFGCVGVIVDGAIRDLEEMKFAGFKALARRLCVGHAYATPIRWGCEVEVFGSKIKPGQLIHADHHGFLAVPHGEEKGLLEASVFMDDNECKNLISTARASSDIASGQLIKNLQAGAKKFGEATQKKFNKDGEF